jgi:hypothetical protein
VKKLRAIIVLVIMSLAITPGYADTDSFKKFMREVKKQQGGAFDETHSSQVGRQLGAKYFLTGKVYDSAERTDGERRVQYFLFMKVVEVETAVVRWQNEANLTKGLVD